MRTNHPNAMLLVATFVLCIHSLSAQKNKLPPIDSTLEANSEKWKVKLHKGLGMGRPEFGPYKTVEIKKLDSPVFRKSSKVGSYAGASITSAGWDWDFSKYEINEKRKAYRMSVGNGADTTELLFSFYRVSHDKRLTFFGEMMSKNDEGKDQTLAYKKNISGVMAVGIDAVTWRFFMEDSVGRNEGQDANPFGTTSITRMYVIAGSDSLYTEPIMHQIGKPGAKRFWEWQNGVFIKNENGDRIAALKFGFTGDLSNSFYVWIRKDIEPEDQHAIASLFALLLVTKTN